MTLQDLNSELDYFTERIASETVKLDYAGIAIVWMFYSKLSTFPTALLGSIACFILSLFLYMIFLFFSARKVDAKFCEIEPEIERNKKIPYEKKETYDFGGWDASIVQTKKRIRRAFFMLCLLGYLILGAYAVRMVFFS